MTIKRYGFTLRSKKNEGPRLTLYWGEKSHTKQWKSKWLKPAQETFRNIVGEMVSEPLNRYYGFTLVTDSNDRSFFHIERGIKCPNGCTLYPESSNKDTYWTLPWEDYELTETNFLSPLGIQVTTELIPIYHYETKSGELVRIEARLREDTYRYGVGRWKKVFSWRRPQVIQYCRLTVTNTEDTIFKVQDFNLDGEEFAIIRRGALRSLVLMWTDTMFEVE